MIWARQMNDDVVSNALALWGMDNARVSLAAARENTVYRIEHKSMLFALRFHRAGYRSESELVSELMWMGMLAKHELPLPRPVASIDGKFCHHVAGITVDVLSWLEGTPMGRNGELANLENPTETYRALGQSMARLHLLSDQWQTPATFSRPSWDATGLLGDEPLWGRFWENPTLTDEQARRLLELRTFARETLDRSSATLDYGLIHADLVPENVLVNGSQIQLIDFDDSGFGFRLFDIATTLNRAKRTDAYDKYKDAFLDGYQSARSIDLGLLSLFQALRALTYIGWIVPRIEEPGGLDRNKRFINETLFWAEHHSSSM